MNNYGAEIRNGVVSFLLFLICFTQAFAKTADSVSDTLLLKTGIRFVANIDSRSSFIQHRHVNIKGFNAGISFGQKRDRITLGYYWLGYNSSQRLIELHKRFAPTFNFASYAKTDVRFVDFAYWHTVIRTKKWVLSIPFEIGVGVTRTNIFKTSNDSLLLPANHYFCPVQVGVYGEYKLFPWFGLNVQTGYRNAISPSPFRHRFAGIYYSYGLSVYPYPIWRDLKKLVGKNN
jgi:hypothetical protein